jgi:hypothetical protein
MYEVDEIDDYREKWLEAERDLAIHCWREDSFISVRDDPLDEMDSEIAPAEMNVI